MENLRVNLEENSYYISFNTDFSNLSGVLSKINAPKKLLIVTDTNVQKLYLDEVLAVVKKSGYEADFCVISAGEQNKNIDTLSQILKSCFQNRLDRKSMLLALGGGVVGDMTGFAASMYMRGISYIQIPTTLLSQSDSSVGGKTGIDFMGAKNILGAFIQPKHVYINVSTIKTLPDKEIISGLGEVIKHGIIKDAEFFGYLFGNISAVKALEPDILLNMCRTNCAIKANIVEEDEKENGVRAFLNFGHTIGHAVESASCFTLTHGASVGLGIIAESYIAAERGLISKEVLRKIIDIFDSYGFETRTKITNPDMVLDIMRTDKKSVSGILKFVLPTAIGTVKIFNDVSDSEIRSALEFISL